VFAIVVSFRQMCCCTQGANCELLEMLFDVVWLPQQSQQPVVKCG